MTDDVRQFFGCYFHQDWRVEYASYQEAVLDFTNGASTEQLQSVLDFVVGVLVDDAENFEMTKYGGFYAPRLDGVSNAKFLNDVKTAIEAKAAYSHLLSEK